MARQITVDLVSDTRDFERGMASAGKATERLEADLKSTTNAASKFDNALDKTTDGLGSSTDKFRSTADLAGGLGDVLGVSALGPMASYATGMADIADGLGGLLAPALAKSKAAFLAMNTTLMANPIFLVVASLAALTAGFVIAYKKSETFRRIVDGALSAVSDAAQAFSRVVVDAVQWSARQLGRVAELITAPYREAFRAIAWLWNNTVGRLEVNIPGFLGFGGVHFGVPDIPQLAKGGIVNRPTIAMIGERGPEAVIPLTGPAAGGVGGTQRVEIHLSGDAEMVALMRKSIRTRGGLTAVFGPA